MIPRLPVSRFLLAAMLLIGLLMRALLFDSYPVLEIDFYRYLWDGAVLANGFNPYALPPALMPIFFARFYFDFRGQAVLFDDGIVWLQYLPSLWRIVPAMQPFMH